MNTDTFEITSTRRLVLGGCGCWWVEHVPASAVIDAGEPRVCSRHKADHPASVFPSPQGMAMVKVAYITDAEQVEAARKVTRR